MVAVDRQGKRTLLEFFLEPDAATVKPAVVATPKCPGKASAWANFTRW
jgi:hypothetical protein